MKLSQLLSSEVKTAMRNYALDCEAKRYGQMLKKVRRQRSGQTEAGCEENSRSKKPLRECKCTEGRYHGKANHYARHFRAERIFSIDLSRPDREKGKGRLIIFEGVCHKCSGAMYKGETLCDYRLTGRRLLLAAVDTVMRSCSKYGLAIGMEEAWNEVGRFLPAKHGISNPGRCGYGSKDKT